MMDTSKTDDPSKVVESKGYESSTPRRSGECVDDAREATVEPIRVVNSSVPEKVIFCIDSICHSIAATQALSHIVNNYMDLKTRVSVKPVEFAILLLGSEINRYVTVDSKKHVNNAILAMSKLELDETEPFDFTGLFTDLANIVKLPDHTFYGDDLLPPHVYHFIVIFGRNLFIPTIKSTNAFYFLMESPYLAFDMLYLHRQDIVKNKCKKIAKALQSLVDENKGFFEECPLRSTYGHAKAVNRFIGHPLIRFPQKSAVFDYIELHAVCAN